MHGPVILSGDAKAKGPTVSRAWDAGLSARSSYVAGVVVWACHTLTQICYAVFAERVVFDRKYVTPLRQCNVSRVRESMH